MITKILGSVMVISASTLAGLYISNLDSKRAIQLIEMKRALTILKSEISYALTPLPQALLNISLRTKEPVSSLFLNIAKELEERNGQFGRIWERELLSHEGQTYWKRLDIEQFMSLGSSLGYLDGEMQLNGIEMVISYIDMVTEELKVSSDKNKKMYRSLGVLGGILIVIVLL